MVVGVDVGTGVGSTSVEGVGVRVADGEGSRVCNKIGVDVGAGPPQAKANRSSTLQPTRCNPFFNVHLLIALSDLYLTLPSTRLRG